MLPFLGKEETSLRRLESQLQQRECQISNLEASLAKAKSDAEKLKGEVDQLRHALREANGKTLQQEQQLERYTKELKPKKELCAWLQEQVAYLKKEIESKAAREKELNNKFHQKTEETDRIKAELQTVRRELEHVKGSMQTTDVHAARFRSEAQAEIQRLQSEVASKTRSIALLEDSLNGKEYSEEQREQLQKASGYEKLSEELKERQVALKAAQMRIQELEGQLHEAEFLKTELEQLRKNNQHLIGECKRLGGEQDEGRVYLRKIQDLEAEKQALTEALSRLEQQWQQQEGQIREMTLQIEAKQIKGEGLQLSADNLDLELKNREQELSGVRAQCERLQEENNKLYEHVAYTEVQLNRAKDAIDAKQGILENERAMNDGDRKTQESTGRLIQTLRGELESSRRRIAELTTKDRRARDAIQALERKTDEAKHDAVHARAQSQHLDKELKSSQVEVLKLQQQLSEMAEKMGLYKSRLTSLREELSENEKSAQGQARGGRLPKCPEYYTLQERVRMLEEEIVAERNSHSVTKNMLKQESENRTVQSGKTHVSTPFPVPGSNFRFSYCRTDQPHVEMETPSLTMGVSGHGSREGSRASADAAVIVEERETGIGSLSLTPLTEGGRKTEVDDGAMEVDPAEPVRLIAPFATPGPPQFLRPTALSRDIASSNRRATLDFHELHTEVFRDATRHRSAEK